MASLQRRFTLIFALSILLIFIILPNVQAWEMEDHEIFELVDRLTMTEGEDVTFYSFLNV
ncbi:17923_t:CDS:2, partial [Acaulospora morrowiae]